jgi:hypothetical protein
MEIQNKKYILFGFNTNRNREDDACYKNNIYSISYGEIDEINIKKNHDEKNNNLSRNIIDVVEPINDTGTICHDNRKFISSFSSLSKKHSIKCIEKNIIILYDEIPEEMKNNKEICILCIRYNLIQSYDDIPNILKDDNDIREIALEKI